MHPTTLALLDALRSRQIATYAQDYYQRSVSISAAVAAWTDAGYPDADPEPAAARAPTLDDPADAVARLEASQLAGGADIRAELGAPPAVSAHGPCDGGGASVRSALPASIPPAVRAWVQARLDAGEAKYGTVLRVGWARAEEALREELADAIAYSVALERPDLAAHFGRLLADGLTLPARPRLRDRVWRWVGVDRG